MSAQRVMIADDTAYMRLMIRKACEKMGLLVVAEAESGPDAVTHYKSHQPDLLILNIVMPGKGGMVVLQEVREYNPSAKVIMCSAIGQAPTIFKVIRAGASDYIIKPFTEARLMQSIQQTLGEDIPPQESQTS